MKNQKIDHRVRYTKMVIKESLLELMKEKSINNITVTEICKLADINRNTFYCHYDNQFELLESLEDELYKDIIQIVEVDMNCNTTTSLTYALCKYIKDNQSICEIILSDNGEQKLLERIMYISYDYTKNAYADIDTELNIAWLNWRQEIQIYWQRALYFFGFISIIGAGYLKIKTTVPSDPIASLLFSMLFTFLAFCWYLSNRGSKFWQENWELHIKELESLRKYSLTGVLSKQIDNKKILSSYPFSPYKINTLISLTVFVFSFACMTGEIVSLFDLAKYTNKWILLVTVVFLLFIIRIPKMVKFRKFK